MDFTCEYIFKKNIVLLYFYDKGKIVSHISFNFYPKEKILCNFHIYISKDHRALSKLHDFMCEQFNLIHNKHFKNYCFEYLYVNKRFEILINRKVKYSKLPMEVLNYRSDL